MFLRTEYYKQRTPHSTVRREVAQQTVERPIQEIIRNEWVRFGLISSLITKSVPPNCTKSVSPVFPVFCSRALCGARGHGYGLGISECSEALGGGLQGMEVPKGVKEGVFFTGCVASNQKTIMGNLIFQI